MERFKNQTFQVKLLVALLFLLLNVALITLVGIPGIKSVDGVAAAHNEKLQRVEQMLANEKIIEEKKANIEILGEQVASFEQQVPDNIDYPQVVYDFYTYSKALDMNPLNLTFSEAVSLEIPVVDGENPEATAEEDSDNGAISTLSLNYTTTGTPQNIVRFLEDLDSISPLALTIDHLMIYEMENGELGVEINFRQYVRGLEDSNIPYTEYTFFQDTVGYDDVASLFKSSAVQVSASDESSDEAESIELTP